MAGLFLISVFLVLNFSFQNIDIFLMQIWAEIISIITLIIDNYQARTNVCL